jgi:dihydrofolate reductase
MAPLALVVAIARRGVIGDRGRLPWKIPEDLRHFKQVTVGHAVIMGRKTWDSIGKPLVERRNLVVSRDRTLRLPGAEVFGSFEEALAAARATDEAPRVIGGAAIYGEALPIATTIFLTEIDRDVEGDTYFSFDRSAFREVDRRRGVDPSVAYVVLERI